MVLTAPSSESRSCERRAIGDTTVLDELHRCDLSMPFISIWNTEQKSKRVSPQFQSFQWFSSVAATLGLESMSRLCLSRLLPSFTEFFFFT